MNSLQRFARKYEELFNQEPAAISFVTGIVGFFLFIFICLCIEAWQIGAVFLGIVAFIFLVKIILFKIARADEKID